MTSSQSTSGDELAKSSRGSRKKKNKEANDVFCICRRPEGNRFMIGCDCCDEWYHGDCVGISRAEGKHIDIYYCQKCISERPNLKIIYFKRENKDANSSIPQRCTECVNCIMKPDCGVCKRCVSKNGRCINVQCKLNVDKNTESERKVYRKTLPPSAPSPSPSPPLELSENEADDEAYSPLASTSRKTGVGGLTGGSGKQPPRGRKKEKPVKKGVKERPQRRGYESTLGDRLVEGSEAYRAWFDKEMQALAPKFGPIQCLGRGCIYEARPDSKYCSTECGMSLAKARLLQLLPKAVKEFHGVEPVSANKQREEMKRKEKEKTELNTEKKKLDEWCKLVLDFVNALKGLDPDDNEEGKGGDGDFVVVCKICTLEYGNRIIARHVERCFARIEKQTTYGTNTPCPVNPHSIFCDQYNKSNNTYCKRLRILCPEHYKGDIEEGVKICGYPNAWFYESGTTLEEMLTSVDDITSKGMCGRSRKDCKQHCGWIVSILGMIDSRRINYYQRMEELCEKKNAKIGDARLLLSNHTEYHQPIEKILHDYKTGEAKALKERRGPVLSTVL